LSLDGLDCRNQHFFKQSHKQDSESTRRHPDTKMKTHGGKKRKLKRQLSLVASQRKICRSITTGKVAKKSRKFGKESRRQRVSLQWAKYVVNPSPLPSKLTIGATDTLKPDQSARYQMNYTFRSCPPGPVSTVCLGLASKKFYTLCSRTIFPWFCDILDLSSWNIFYVPRRPLVSKNKTRKQHILILTIVTSQYKKLPLDTFSEAQVAKFEYPGEALEAWIRGTAIRCDLKLWPRSVMKIWWCKGRGRREWCGTWRSSGMKRREWPQNGNSQPLWLFRWTLRRKNYCLRSKRKNDLAASTILDNSAREDPNEHGMRENDQMIEAIRHTKLMLCRMAIGR